MASKGVCVGVGVGAGVRRWALGGKPTRDGQRSVNIVWVCRRIYYKSIWGETGRARGEKGKRKERGRKGGVRDRGRVRDNRKDGSVRGLETNRDRERQTNIDR